MLLGDWFFRVRREAPLTSGRIWPFFDIALIALTVSWQNITAVVLFEHSAARTKLQYIGLKGRTPPQAPATSGQKINTSRPISGWTLDRDRLAAAISANAPHVTLQVVE